MQCSYVTSTGLPRHRVWDLLTDIQTWPKLSNTCLSFRWVGEAWAPGSYLLNRVHDPAGMELSHVVRTCQAPALLRVLSYGGEFGFAVESTIQLDQIGDRTRIRVDAYAVGNPTCSLPGGVSSFLKRLAEQWCSDFARFCELQPTNVSEHNQPRLQPALR